MSSDRYLNLLDQAAFLGVCVAPEQLQAEVEAFWQEAGVRGGTEHVVSLVLIRACLGLVCFAQAVLSYAWLDVREIVFGHSAGVRIPSSR